MSYTYSNVEKNKNKNTKNIKIVLKFRAVHIIKSYTAYNFSPSGPSHYYL